MNVHLLRKMKQPPGENLFLVSALVDDSDPCWDTRYSTVGNWAAIQNAIALFHFPKNFSVLLLQGDNVRSYLLNGAREELRYQLQRANQPNN